MTDRVQNGAGTGAAAECEEYFKRWTVFSEDVQSTLNQTAAYLTQHQGGKLWAANTVAVRILLRTCSNFHAVRSLVSIDLVPEPRTHVRSIIESAFALVGLQNDPQRFLEVLEEDAAASSKRQSRFVMKNFELPDEDHAASLMQLAESEEKYTPLNVRDLAEKLAYEPLYLAYLQLSESAVHYRPGHYYVVRKLNTDAQAGAIPMEKLLPRKTQQH